MKNDLRELVTVCEAYKDAWAIQLVKNTEKSAVKLDKKETIQVLNKFYKFSYLNSKDERKRNMLLITNKGTLIENDTYEDRPTINGRDQCLGESENSWAAALWDIKTTSDFLAQLAVFANKHAR